MKERPISHLKSIANNTEIDVIWDNYQETLEPLRQQLNSALNQKWEEWEIPREADELGLKPINLLTLNGGMRVLPAKRN